MTDKNIFIHDGTRSFLCECGNVVAVTNQTECSTCGIHWQTTIEKR